MRRAVAIRTGGDGTFATAAILYDDTAACDSWPECGCDGECLAGQPAARPFTRWIEGILVGSLVLLAAFLLFIALHR